MTDHLPRELTPFLARALRRLPVVVLTGLRQVGKTTLLREEDEFAGRRYETLDDLETQAAVQADPRGLLARPERLTLDEVQRAPELLPQIKAEVDRRKRAGQYLLSGSANLALMAGVSETLAGRALYLTLHPMTRREIHRRTAKLPILVEILRAGNVPESVAEPVKWREVVKGGLPPVCLDESEDAELWYRGYVQTYIERDLRQISQITDLVSFRMLTNLAALRTGQILNISSIGRDARLSAATAGRYMHLLETTFLIRRVPPFLGNESSRLIKSPKLYFTDSGLAAYLANARQAKSAETIYGALWETWAMQNFASILEAHLPDTRLSYWHEQGRHEVDLVVESGRKVFAFEIKATVRWSESDLRGLRAFAERTPTCAAAILAYNGTKTVSLGNKIWAVPLGALVQ